MAYARHYFNPKTRKMACQNHTKRFTMVRDWTEDKAKVTCKHCLTILARWAQQKTK